MAAQAEPGRGRSWEAPAFTWPQAGIAPSGTAQTPPGGKARPTDRQLQNYQVFLPPALLPASCPGHYLTAETPVTVGAAPSPLTGPAPASLAQSDNHNILQDRSSPVVMWLHLQ